MPSVLGSIETRLSTLIVSSVCRTVRLNEENTEFFRKRVRQQKKGLVCSFWHNRLFLLTYYYATRIYRNGGPELSVMISRSRDGEKIARVAKQFGYHVVRGSTSRRGQAALRRMVRMGRQGHPVGITPDGPRGPRYRVQNGAAYLALSTDLPIVPISFGVNRFHQFRSWDRFIFPFPYSSGVIVCGDPIWPRSVSGDVDSLRKRLERKMHDLDDTLEDMGYEFE